MLSWYPLETKVELSNIFLLTGLSSHPGAGVDLEGTRDWAITSLGVLLIGALVRDANLQHQ